MFTECNLKILLARQRLSFQEFKKMVNQINMWDEFENNGIPLIHVLLFESDYNIYFDLCVLSSLTALLQLINTSTDKCYNFIKFSIQINAVNLFLSCHIFILMTLHNFLLFFYVIFASKSLLILKQFHLFCITSVSNTISLGYGVQVFLMLIL